MKRGAAGGGGSDDNNPSRAGKRAKKPREKGSGSMKVKSGDFELDLNRFPDKLRWLLDNEIAPEALWWLQGGDAIGINKKAFEEQLLEQEFRGNKFSSITRKLNRWGFRRIDDESRVPKGSIAYSHDFFVQSAIARMRFMKKEEDRKPAAEEDDAKSGEETPGESSLRNLMGDNTQQSTGMGNAAPSAAVGLAHSPASQAGLLARILNVPGADLPPIALAQDQHQRNFLANQTGTGSQLPASFTALANSQLSDYPAAASPADLFSFQNQLTGSLYHLQQFPQGRLNQQQLLQERHHQLLVQERTQQLQRLLGASIGHQQLELSQGLSHGGSHTITETGLPSLIAGRPSVVPSDTHVDPQGSVANLTQLSALDLSLSRMLAGNVAVMENASAPRAPTAIRPPDLALLNQNADLSRLFAFQQPQNQHVGQGRLHQIQQQLGAGGDPPAALSLLQGRRGDVRPEEKEERKEAR